MSLAERMAARLAASHDGELLTGDDVEITGSLTAAAVLVAITDRTEPGVILTQRTEQLRAHPGQVAFPGGRLDSGEDAVAAALREAEEEIGLSPDAVTVIGTADRYLTRTGFDITPVLGVVPPDLPLTPSEAEVAAVFEVPLAFLFDVANRRENSMTWRGEERRFFELVWEERRIWGVTAGIIVNLARRLA